MTLLEAGSLLKSLISVLNSDKKLEFVDFTEYIGKLFEQKPVS